MSRLLSYSRRSHTSCGEADVTRFEPKMRTTSARLLTPYAERALLVGVLVLMMLFASGCESVSLETADPCIAFEPITTTRGEQSVLSDETMAQIDGHNATWLELCDQ